MNTSRRHALRFLAMLPVSIAGATAAEEKADAANLMGSWFVTSATTSFVFSIEPKNEGLFLFIENGSFSIGRIRWKPLPGGVLLEGLPRIRLWAGRNADEVRAEREDFPTAEVSRGFKQFPLSFFMKRVTAREVPASWLNRPLPGGWEEAALTADWDEKAGERRTAQ
jgi:hypothetical protein